MKRIIRNITTLLFAGILGQTVSAQEFRSSYFAQTSNYRHQMNPALLDSAYVGALLGNINIGATGNVGLSNFVYKLEGNPQYDLTTFMSPTVNANDFLNDLHEQNRANVYLNYNLFSLGFKMLKGVSLVEVNVRSNTNANVPKTLFEFMKTTGAKEQYHIEDLGIRSQNYVEVALGHSRNINEKWRIGAKLKILLGAAYADFSADQMDITLNGDYWRIQGNAIANAAILKSNIIVDENKPDPNNPNRYRVDDLDDVSFGLPGKGFAVDLGVTYQFNKDLTFSAAITDLGFISWKDTHKATSQGDYTFDGFEDIYVHSGEKHNNEIEDQFDQMGDDLEDMFAVYYDGKGKVSQALASTVRLGAEYTLPVYRPLRFGFLYTGRIQSLYSWHQGMFSANIRPLKWIEASVNMGFSNTGTTFGGLLSLKAKHFNFYIGADSFLGKVSKEFIPLNNMNANVNLGMTFPL